MKFLMTLIVLFFTAQVHAAEYFENTTSLGIFNRIVCGLGLDCSQGADRKLVIQAGTVEVASASGALSITDCGATYTLTASDNLTLDLPEASTAIGCEFGFATLNASATVTVNPDDADQILGETNAAGDAISNNTVGDSIRLRAVSDSQWIAEGTVGTWADAN